MAQLVKVLGIPALKSAVKQHNKGLAMKSEKALYIVGLFLQRHAQLLVPVDTGNLRNSAFTRKEGKGWKTTVRVGFTARYAVYVHEDLMAYHRVGQAKYLEDPLINRRDEMRQLYKKEVGRGSGRISFGNVGGAS